MFFPWCFMFIGVSQAMTFSAPRCSARTQTSLFDHHSSVSTDQTFPVFSLKTTSEVRIGGLRMLLSLLLVSEQNEPTKNAWTPSQDENSLSMLFNKSGSWFTITIYDRGLAVTQTNPNPPTLEYKLQEALKLHKVLDELQDLATTTEISPEKRLLLLDDNAIESARSHILARPPQPS